MATVSVPASGADDDMSRAHPAIRIVRLVLRLIFRLFFRIRIDGAQNLPETTCIYALNHLGWTDPFLPLLFFPIEPRIYVLGERQVMLRSRWRRWAITTARIMVPLDRGEPRRALRTMSETLRRGGSLIIFPEGHLGSREGELQALQAGAARLAIQGDVPIVPVGLTGTSDLWLRRHLTIRIGTPLYPQNGLGIDTKTQAATMTEALATSLRTLLPGDEVHPRVKPFNRVLTRLL